MQQRLSLGNSSQAIVVTEQEFDEDGFVIGQRTGLIPIDATRNGEEMLEKAAKHRWEVYGSRNLQGFQSARKVRSLSEKELATSVIARRSIIVTLDEDDVTRADRDVIQRQSNVIVGSNVGDAISLNR